MSEQLWLALLGAGVLAYLAVGLMPFNFDFARPLKVHWVFITPVNGVLNWLCFVPLGFVIARLSWIDRPVLAAVLVCACLSLAVESLQIFLPGRYSCFSDWALNTAGGLTGAWAAASS